MSSPAVWWIVAGRCTKHQSKDTLFSILKSRIGEGKGLCEDGFPLVRFDVPDGEHSLKFGSFDNLIRLTDDLVKYDSQVESVLRRLERQYLEIDPNGSFVVQSQRNRMPFEKYMRCWQWDDAKYPKSRAITDNLTLLLTSVTKLEEEARNKAAHYNDLKSQRGNFSKQEGGNFYVQFLTDILTPDVVRAPGGAGDDFIYTEHMTTVVIVVPANRADDLKTVCSVVDGVVPLSAQRLGAGGRRLEDRDGNTLWRVLLFKTAVENFQHACYDRRLTVREFEYSVESHAKSKQHREQVEKEFLRHHAILKNFCLASWSDTMIAWFHIKAMRVFVESVLRFGVPPHFASFLIQPKHGKETLVRKELTSILRVPNASHEPDGVDEGEEYYPYVSFTFSPFSIRSG